MKYFRYILLSTTVLLNILLFSFFLGSFQSLTFSNNTILSKNEDQSEATDKNVDPKAVEILRNSLNYFANLKLFSAKSQSTLEDINESGHKVDYEFAGQVVVQRPNHLHSERYGEKMHQIFYYDGKTLTLHNPDEKVYATEPAPGTIDNMFHVARDSFGISVPVSDLVYSNSFELLYQNIDYAVVIGKEMVGDVQCDHLLFSRNDADFQVWFADSGFI